MKKRSSQKSHNTRRMTMITKMKPNEELPVVKVRAHFNPDCQAFPDTRRVFFTFREVPERRQRKRYSSQQ